MIAGGLGFDASNIARVTLAILMPFLVAVLIVLQIRSGLALDSKWVAKYPHGTWQYRCLIAWNFIALALMIYFAATVLSS